MLKEKKNFIVSVLVALLSFLLVYFFSGGLVSVVNSLIISFGVGVFVFVIIHLQYVEPLQKISLKIGAFLNKNEPPSGTNLTEDIDSLLNELIKGREKEIDHLKTLEKHRKEYIGNVSHELKTPIFNIHGYIQTLLDGGLEDDAVNRSFLEKADKSTERMINIVEDLQTISQLESGELSLDLEPFDLLMLAKDVCESLEIRAKTKNISLTTRTFESIPYLVNADKFRVRQVLVNLVVNSIKYGKEGGETKILLRDANNFIKIDVSDNGVGIENKHLPRLFERFYRVDKSRSREQGGSGLGLAIVKHILDAHRQTINVISTPNVGSSFSFMLEKAKTSTSE